MQCNGKCHLMKELAKASESEKPISSDKKTATQEVEILFFEVFKSFKINSLYFDETPTANYFYSNFYCYLKSDSVFRPPSFIS